MSVTLGILGCGNMGGAILKGLAARKDLGSVISLMAYDRYPERCVAPGVKAAKSVEELAGESDILLLALKPQQLPEALQELAPKLGAKKLLVSVAAGLSQEALRKASGGKTPVARVMPNISALAGAGTFGLCLDDPGVSEEQKSLLQQIFGSLGRVFVLPEEKFNAFSALAGCGPAYVFYFMEAMAQAGVTLGFTSQEAFTISLDVVLGAGLLARGSGVAPAILREQVCSPGGMTIEAINQLDRLAVRGHIIEAILAAFEKGRALSK